MISVPVEDLADEVFAEHSYLFPAINRAAEYLLILAWETTEDWHDQTPAWEFLRHCRNAAAHGGSFHFLHEEPRRPANWQGLTITADLEGTPLMQEFLQLGDPIHLLWDLERTTD